MIFKCVLVELFLKHGMCHNIHGEKHPRLLVKFQCITCPLHILIYLSLLITFTSQSQVIVRSVQEESSAVQK